MTSTNFDGLVAAVKFNEQGLVPAIAQDSEKGDVLMMAWMNETAIRETLETGRVCYWSRSRGGLWRKGESSGQHQELVDFLLDCDGDTILLKVRQHGVACHTGRRSCFYRSASRQGELTEIMDVEIDPKELYSS